MLHNLSTEEQDKKHLANRMVDALTLTYRIESRPLMTRRDN